MSAITLKVRDETTSGDVLAELELQLSVQQVTVRELIRERVHQEVRTHNAAREATPFFGLVQPTDTERELNGYRVPRGRMVNPERQTEAALAGFTRGQVLVLVDDRQVEQLDDVVHVGPGTSVTFLKLVPLVGG